VWGSGNDTVQQRETSNDRVSWCVQTDRQSFIPSILAAAVQSGRATVFEWKEPTTPHNVT